MFYETEIALRRQLKYPPFCDIIMIGISSASEQEVEKAYQEYDIFNRTQPIESDFDKVVKGLAKTEK